MTQAKWFPSPAKINRFLHVTGQRADGYHLLQTIFQFVDYGDSIGVEVNSSGRISRRDEHDFLLPEVDLCIAAAESLKQQAGDPTLGVEIVLRKFVRPGTGLGAGSSNAATVLLALNRLWDLNYSADQLLELSKPLGADVPVFVYGRSVWAEGTGDIFTDVSPDTGMICLAIPQSSVATAVAFSDPDLQRNHPAITYHDFLQGNAENVLEPIVSASDPLIASTLDYLEQFGNARMSGTGSAVFVPIATETKGQEIISGLPSGVDGVVATSSNISACHRFLDTF